MIDHGSSNRLDRELRYQTSSVGNDSGDVVDDWSEVKVYAGILTNRLNSKEDFEDEQEVNKERRAYLVRKEALKFEPDKTRFAESDDTYWFYMTGSHPFKGSRNYMVIEGVARDNEVETG